MNNKCNLCDKDSTRAEAEKDGSTINLCEFHYKHWLEDQENYIEDVFATNS